MTTATIQINCVIFRKKRKGRLEINGKKEKCLCGNFLRIYRTGKKGGMIKKVICMKMANPGRIVYQV